MIKIYFNNELKEVPIGTMVIDLIEDNKKTDYMVCQIGSQIKELRHTLTEKNNNMPVIPIGINHIEAGKAYEATLRYVIAMAFHNLYPRLILDLVIMFRDPSFVKLLLLIFIYQELLIK